MRRILHGRNRRNDHDADCAAARNFRALFEQSPIGMLAVDRQTARVTEANCAALSMFGYDAQTIRQRDLIELTHPDDRAGTQARIEQIRQGVEELAAVEKRYLRSDGGAFEAEAHLALLRDDDGMARGAVISIVDITERKRVAAQAQAARSHLQAVLDAMPDLLFEVDGDGRILDYHSPRTDLLAAPPEAFLGRRFTDVLPPDVGAVILGALREAAAMGHASGAQYALELPQGRRHFELAVARKAGEPGQEPRFVLLARDVTRRRQAEDELRIAAIAFESHEGMLVTDADGVIRRVNRSLTRMTGYTADELIGHTPALLRSGRYDRGFYARMWKAVRVDGFWQGEIVNRRKDGALAVDWLTISVVRSTQGEITHFVGTLSDMSREKQAEARADRLANFDGLTELPNRSLLVDRIAHAIAASGRSLQHGALLLIDLDHFRNINDSLGHRSGDELLVLAARRMRTALREGDTLGRYGGDKFGVVLEGLGPDATAAARTAGHVAEKLRQALAERHQLGTRATVCTASIGVTLFRGATHRPEVLVQQAELAMYRAKTEGRDAWRLFEQRMQQELDARYVLEGDLRDGIERGEFVLFYQPQVDRGGRVLGAEALLRWNHPVRGLLGPAEFIGLAEETGLIEPLGRWVIQQACTQLACWGREPRTRALRLAVNVSPRQFRAPDFVEGITGALRRALADPAALKLEITESMVLEDIDDAARKLAALRSAGVCVALDDFGTGSSALSYLTRLPVDQIKIDRSFICNLPARGDALVVQTILTMARGLGLEVVVEGVETEEQLAFLERLECDVYQGYRFGRPVSLAQFEAQLDGVALSAG